MLKHKKFMLGAIVCSLLLFLTLQIPNSNATVVWSDDFNDGNYNDWTILEGTYNATNEYLETTNPAQSLMHQIRHDSSVIYGFWSFDLYVNASTTSLITPNHIILLMADELEDSINHHATNAFELDVVTNTEWVGIRLSKYTPEGWDVLAATSLSAFDGWQEFNITRDCYGNFDIYLNETLQLEWTDNSIFTSNYFVWRALEYNAIDNIVVGEVDCTVIIPPPPMELILIGVGVTVVIVIVVIVVIVYRRRTT